MKRSLTVGVARELGSGQNSKDVEDEVNDKDACFRRSVSKRRRLHSSRVLLTDVATALAELDVEPVGKVVTGAVLAVTAVCRCVRVGQVASSSSQEGASPLSACLAARRLEDSKLRGRADDG